MKWFESRSNFLMLLFFSQLALGSCMNDSGWGNFGTYPNDPIARSGGFSSQGGMGERGLFNEPQNSVQYDVGITLRRFADLTGRPFTPSLADAAFEIRGNPAQVDGISINGVSLSWIESSKGEYNGNSYGSYDIASYGQADSMEFSYANFDGESYTARVAFSDFGKCTAPDTISTSEGFALHYQKYFSRDSLLISIQSMDSIPPPAGTGSLVFKSYTVPDTGTIAFPPNFLPPTKNLQYWIVQISRPQFTTVLSPHGKRIGVSTMQSISPWIPARP